MPLEEAEGLPQGLKAPKQPSAGDRKRGAWVPQYSNLIYIMLVSSVGWSFEPLLVCNEIKILITPPNWVGLETQRNIWNRGGHTSNDDDVCAGTHKHAAQKFLAFLGPYLSKIVSDLRDQSIYGIRRTCMTFLSTYFIPSTQACMHACSVLAHLGPYISQIGLDQKDQENIPDLSEFIL